MKDKDYTRSNMIDKNGNLPFYPYRVISKLLSYDMVSTPGVYKANIEYEYKIDTTTRKGKIRSILEDEGEIQSD